MATNADNGSELDFARAFGDQLQKFIEGRNLSYAEAAVKLGLDKKKGKSRLNSYFHDSPRFVKKLNKRVMLRTSPDARILCAACTKLGFTFEYKGYRVSAETFPGAPAQPLQPEQLMLRFNRQFNLTGDRGAVRVKVDRPHGEIQLFVSLKAKAS